MAGATLPLSPDPFAGRTLGKYEVLCRLSTGGMSEIFLAFQRGLAGFRKLLVIKSILPNIQGEEEFVRMFLDEAKITAAFNHPNIAQVFDLDVDDECLFLAMEFVPGCTLVELARACRAANEPIPTGFTLLAVKETALALHYAHNFVDPLGHKQTVIHRDVAEKNIMVTFEGTTKLLDFGIAKSLNRTGRTSVGMVKGTSGYMSPEQIMGEPLDPRSDLFSLGVVLHECLTGMRLFHGKDAEAGMIAALKDVVAPPSELNAEVPAAIDAVVLKALARKRDDRQSSCLEFARALERAAGPLMWHPEQSGELVNRLFADRREQTRQLLEEAQHGKAEVTREIRLAGLLGDPKNAPAATPFKATPSLATPRKPIESPGADNRPAARRTGASSAVKAPALREPTPVARQPVVTEPGRPPAPEPMSEVTQVGQPPRAPARSRSNPAMPVPWTTSSETNVAAPGETSDDTEFDEGQLTMPGAALPKALFDSLDEDSPAPRARSNTSETLTQRNGRDENTTNSGPTPISRPTQKRGSPLPFFAAGALLLVVLLGVGYLLDLHRLFGRAEAPAAKPPPGKVAPAAVERPPPPKVPDAPVVVAPPPTPAPVVEPDPEPEPSEPSADVKTLPTKAAAKPKKRVPVEGERHGAPGQLTLVTDPWAKVLYKSQELGITPLFKVNLPSGHLTLKLIGADQKVLLLPVDIKEGAVTAVRVPLSGLKAE
jgi:serine/threonine protein kinase